MKAIIPVAGAGTTLRPHTHTQPKPLIPVAGKPILGHIVYLLMDAGITDFIFVIGYMGEKIKNYINDEFAGRINCTYVRQEPRLGQAHAIWMCQEHLKDNESILIALGDTIVDADMQAIINDPDNVICVQQVDDPRNFGVAVPDENDYVLKLIEKPSIPKSNRALVGVYKINNSHKLLEATQYLIDNTLKTRNEYQLTDALMHMVNSGIKIKLHEVNQWYDCGQKEVLLETNRILLSQNNNTPVKQYENTIIIPPVYIAENTEISNSIIGPYVSITEHAVIKDSIIQDTILGAYSRLDSIVLKHSVVGNDSRLVGNWHSVNIGDNTEIDFNS